MRMKGSGYKLNVHKCVLQTLKVCVCVSAECSQESLYLLVCIYSQVYLTQHTAWVFIYPAQIVLTEGFDRWSKDHLSTTRLSKDQHLPRRMIDRSSIEGSSFEHLEGSTLSFDELSFDTDNTTNLLNVGQVKPGGRLTWSTYRTDKDIVYIETEYRQSTDTSAPTLSYELSMTWLNFTTLNYY
ncbi:hypothetical protein HanIR_Chr17g0875011 [Helianthus annuus]|nr:hypothetical protein HanIR_Chr17g0875011 [Helianthus annuus]